MQLPQGKEFAFTILDDTDDATVENVGPVYDLLFELGLRTTKTVWPLACPEGSPIFFAGSTLADPDYLDFCQQLAERGFEITWHCATMESSLRERTLHGLEVYAQHFGHPPRVHVNHGHNRENLYWGHKRYRLRPLQHLARRFSGVQSEFDGEVEQSPYFWGDLCQQHCRFVRNFTFYDLNTIKKDPATPYQLRSTPWINNWFSTSDAPDAAAFKTIVTPARIDRLRSERGICILSTHLGKGFARAGKVDPEVEATLRHIAALRGWFVPVSEILEWLLSVRPPQAPLGWAARARLELAHAYDRMRGLR